MVDSLLNQELYDNRGHVETIDSENDFYDIDANSGFPVWLDDETLKFIFSIRYSSEAFTGTFLQEEYRRNTHRQFSSLMKDLITKKIENMRAMPELYADIDQKKRTFDPDLIDKDNVIEIGAQLGIKAEDIDVYTVLGDVVESLEKILTAIIHERPGMSPAEKKFAIDFMDDQLWDEEAKMRWRAVSAEELAKLYSYFELPRAMRVIAQLDEYVQNEIDHGMYQHMNLKYAPIDDILSDAMIENVLSALDDNDKSPDKVDDEWIISETIAGLDDESDW